jgi:mono/diheme cytochrome c family protein
MKLLKRLAILITIFLVGVYSFVQSGIFNVAATVKDNPLISWLLHTTMEKSVERHAQNIEVPDINKNEMILTGLSDYVEMCAQCHGEPDKPSGILTQGLNPAPPNLKHLAEAGTAAEMFWIINNGIRMTGMPAFGNTHQADEIWPVVSFLQSAKDMTPSEFKRMKSTVEDYGHHESASNMNKNSNNMHRPDDANVIHVDHNADTPSTKTSDSQISDVPSLHQEEEYHGHQHGHGGESTGH